SGAARLPEARDRALRAGQADLRPVLALLQATGVPTEPRALVRDRTEHQPGDRQGCAGDGFARLRRRDPLDDHGALDRRVLGAEAAVALRQDCDGVRPDRDLRAPRLDRVDLRVPLRREAEVDADRELRKLLRRSQGLRFAGWPLAVVLPHDLAVVHL